jgi:TonB-dependent SusC/RagA subfamily outer membrane receptor
MTGLALKGLAVATLCTFVALRAAPAQRAIGVSGHVTAEGRPAAGARVRVEALSIDRRTDADGYYSFLITSDRVAGRAIVMTVSYSDRRDVYQSESVTLDVRDAAIVRDFDLRRVASAGSGGVAVAPDSAGAAAGIGRAVDTSGFGALAGAIDLPTALAGRIAGVSVVTSSALGGSSSLTYRGTRSLLSSAQPVFVVDGTLRDNTTFTSSAQRFGAGGLDYGSPIQDINTRDIASVEWFTGADAVARYGSRAANGVVVVTTKDGTDGPRFAIGAAQQYTPEHVFRLPAYQNAYGQGLAGAFEFFDGRGGGVNDAVAENWGPALDGRPLPQASYTEPRRPDVRFWTARPNNVSNFFRSGSTTNTDVTLQGRSGLGSLRLGVGQRHTNGVVPGSDLRRRDVRLHAVGPSTSKLQVNANVAFAEMKGDDAPGSGFNQTNVVSQLSRMGRQVDLDSLRVHVRADDGEQISWNYAGENNPYFASFANSNDRDRNHVTGGVSARYPLSHAAAISASLGSDYYRDDRHFNIAPTWMGGFPFYAGAGDFSKGGFQSDAVAAQRSNGAVRLDATRTVDAARWSFSAGMDFTSTHQRVRTVGIDTAVNVPPAGDTASTAKAPAPESWTGAGKSAGVFGAASVTFANRATLGATLRHDWVTLLDGATHGATYPAFQASLDLLGTLPALGLAGRVNDLRLRGAWWRAGTDATAYAIQTRYVSGVPVSGAIAPTNSVSSLKTETLEPETTTGWEVGADGAMFDRRLDGGFSFYYEHSRNVIIPRVSDDATTGKAVNGAVLRNHGIEGHVGVRAGDPGRSVFWNASVNAALNYNTVQNIADAPGSVMLGPPVFGLGVVAAQGLPLGALYGYRMLRESNGAPLLRDGLPLADSAAGPVLLGNARQNTLYGFSAAIGYQWLSLAAWGDAHVGGSIYSATNYNGDVAGAFAGTGFRPDSGLLIRGTDIGTGTANTTHVSTEAYYHALGAIQEPWLYSATFFKLRQLQLTAELPSRFFASLPFESARLSLIARNVYTWSHNRNFDPETLLSVSSMTGVELGQLPLVRSIGVQLTISP